MFREEMSERVFFLCTWGSDQVRQRESRGEGKEETEGERRERGGGGKGGMGERRCEGKEEIDGRRGGEEQEKSVKGGGRA